MKHNDLVKFFIFQRQIFGQCPCCGELFRLSDCNIYLKGAKQTDWKDKLDLGNQKLSERESEMRKAASLIGKTQAKRAVKKIDPIFSPRKLDHQDAYALFNPIDYIVFNGMGKENYKNIILLDGKKQSPEMKKVQNSIAKTVEKQNYEWVTIRVEENGAIKKE